MSSLLGPWRAWRLALAKYLRLMRTCPTPSLTMRERNRAIRAGAVGYMRRRRMLQDPLA